MGTRSNLFITGLDSNGNPFTQRFYRHYDGYPSSMLETLSGILKEHPKATNHIEELSQQVSALQYESGYGNRQVFEPSEVYSSEFTSNTYGNHGDLEYVYVLDLERKGVSIYGRQPEPFESGSVKHFIHKPRLDPLSELPMIRPEYKEEVRQALENSVVILAELGFSMNPALSSKKTKTQETTMQEIDDLDHKESQSLASEPLSGEATSEKATARELGRAVAVPYELRHEAKKNGAVWLSLNVEVKDKDAKDLTSTKNYEYECWVVPPGVSMDKFQAYLPKVNDQGKGISKEDKVALRMQQRLDWGLSKILVDECGREQPSIKTISSLLAVGADPDSAYMRKGESFYHRTHALHKAAEAGNSDVVKLLIDHGADTEKLDSFKRTPLMKAAYYGQDQTIKALVENGADIHAVDRKGAGLLEIMQLGKSNAKPNDKRFGNFECSQFILEASGVKAVVREDSREAMQTKKATSTVAKGAHAESEEAKESPKKASKPKKAAAAPAAKR